jgi:hypothetical protein
MTPSLLNITPELTASVAAKTVAAQALLAEIAGDWSPATFANSLGAEDMVLTDLIASSTPIHRPTRSKSSVSTPAACRWKPMT